MPVLDASALEADSEGAAFLLAVLRWRPDPRRNQAQGRLSPPLSPHTIRFNRGLAGTSRTRKLIARERDGFGLTQQSSPLRFSQAIPYQVTVRTGALG